MKSSSPQPPALRRVLAQAARDPGLEHRALALPVIPTLPSPLIRSLMVRSVHARSFSPVTPGTTPLS
ncbi:hypothetical protein PBY51_006180 [Eleginops maclovinus]|uniref:Uncharacterized protein n=1 Tax=Eleginops maclovinus TaxID=56733 RepID=A0AAN7WTY9_ELEMC|nr:hypothetical protein PBY51_006180 [Eleginops maclovinus]